MSRFEQSDLSFDVPREWQDRTIVAYTAPPKEGQTSASNFVVTRDEARLGETLRAYADRQLVELARQLDGFDLIERTERMVGGLPAQEIRFAWRGQAGPVEQRLIMVARKRTIVSFNTTAPRHEAEQMRGVFDRIVASIRLPDGPAARAGN